jgi:hypothetical protein
MCERCHAEEDGDYEGNSLEAKRRKAIRAVIERHPELGLDANAVTFRFAPKAEEQCVRVNMGEQSPRYEIHVPGYTAQMMTGAPPLSGIAMAAWIETSKSYEEIAEILAIHARQRFGAIFVTETPPVNTSRVGEAPNVFDYEQAVHEQYTEE